MTDDKVGLFDSVGFKARLLSLPEFPRVRQEEALGSDVSEAHIKLGVVPEQMTQEGFREIIELKELGFDEEYGLPLLPAVQNSWTGTQVADTAKWWMSRDTPSYLRIRTGIDSVKDMFMVS
jgi:hypothetical protein